MTGISHDQLSLLVRQDRRLDDAFRHGQSPVAMGLVNLSGGLRVRRDLNPGDQLYVRVTDGDGIVIAGGEYLVGTPSFPPLKDKGKVIGQMRVVTVELVDGDTEAPMVDDPRSGS